MLYFFNKKTEAEVYFVIILTISTEFFKMASSLVFSLVYIIYIIGTNKEKKNKSE